MDAALALYHGERYAAARDALGASWRRHQRER
jgi:hypothetical protein